MNRTFPALGAALSELSDFNALRHLSKLGPPQATQINDSDEQVERRLRILTKIIEPGQPGQSDWTESRQSTKGPKRPPRSM